MLRKSLVAIMVFVSPMTAYAVNPSDKEVRAMEVHWQIVTNETDANKRKALLENHRNMMSEYSAIKLPDHDGPMGDMHRHDVRKTNIKNTVEMHSSMMGMMQ